ncbi:hypothetical protein K503DRAFT_868356 [Rhizopogon vinicolor AM-OR11-026]|uniref:Uncharacterized protein n=1 Tax=Rhizopogon vinicolor AM-OR11-026 TaxID=1314800 RepID=A0A1B7MRU6_9AGAM|nr:hypothetical protein K503DRAFT_868356 [Rhizopogon vinicolor AM-OR11-026]
MAPTNGTTFAADTGKRRFHNHIFGHAHRARRGAAINTTTLAKNQPLFVHPQSTLPTASGTFALGQPTGSPLPTPPKDNFLVDTIAAIAVAFAIIACLIGLVIAGVILKRTISKRRNRRHRQTGGGSSLTDSVEEKQEDDFDEKYPDSPASSLQTSPAPMESPALHLEHAARSPVQRTMRSSWFVQVFRKARTGFHRKNAESPKEASPFLGGKSAELLQQTTWSDHSSPESLIRSMPLLHRLPEERQDNCESKSCSQIAVTSGRSLHRSLDSFAFASSVHRASQARPLSGLRLSKAVEGVTTVEEAYKGDQKDVQEVSILAVSTERIASPTAEEGSCSETVDMDSELVPTASLQTIGTRASVEHEGKMFGQRGVRTRSMQADKAILVSLGLEAACEGEEDRDDERSNAENEHTSSNRTITTSSTVELLPQSGCLA